MTITEKLHMAEEIEKRNRERIRKFLKNRKSCSNLAKFLLTSSSNYAIISKTPNCYRLEEID